MKTMFKPIAIAIVLVMTGSNAANAQRGMGRMMHDSTRMRMMMCDTIRMGRPGGEMRQMKHMHAPMPTMMCPGCRMAPGPRGGMRPGMGWGPGPGFGAPAGPEQFNRPVFEGKPGFVRPENIPNLTDKQKKDLADLRQKHMDEVKKFREENLAKMKTMRENHRKKVLDLLTDEQKKFVDGNTGATVTEPKKQGK